MVDMRQNRVDEVSYYEPMTLKQIEELSSQIGEYVQPQNQTKSRKYGLVCYATDNREGADTEARKMKDSLEVPQFHCVLNGVTLKQPIPSSILKNAK